MRVLQGVEIGRASSLACHRPSVLEGDQRCADRARDRRRPAEPRLPEPGTSIAARTLVSFRKVGTDPRPRAHADRVVAARNRRCRHVCRRRPWAGMRGTAASVDRLAARLDPAARPAAPTTAGADIPGGSGRSPRPAPRAAAGSAAAGGCSPSTASSAAASWRAPTRPAAGSLAGPLVAAAVLFDLERLTLADRRALAGSTTPSSTPRRPARSSTRSSCGRRRASLIVSRCVRGIDAPRPARDEPRRAAHARCSASPAAAPSASSTASASPTSATSSAPSSTATAAAPRSPPPRCSPRSPATATCAAPPSATGLGLRRRTSATRRPSTAPRSRPTASRRCTGCRSSRSPTQQLALRASTASAATRRAA